MIALKRANEVRTARAKLKQELREGKLRIEQVLARPPAHVSTAQVLDLIVAVPKIGPVKATRLLNTARITRQRPLANSPTASAPALSSCLAHEVLITSDGR